MFKTRHGSFFSNPLKNENGNVTRKKVDLKKLYTLFLGEMSKFFAERYIYLAENRNILYQWQLLPQKK